MKLLWGAASAVVMLAASPAMAQTLNAQTFKWPVGRYKMGTPGAYEKDSAAAFKSYMELRLYPGNQFRFMVNGREADKLDISGTYRQEGARLLFKPAETYNVFADVFRKPGSGNNKNKLTVIFKQDGYAYTGNTVSVYTGNHYDSTQFKALADYASASKTEFDSDDSLVVALPVADSLYVQVSSRRSHSMVTMSYAIVPGTESMYVRNTEANRFNDDWQSIAAQKGENDNEMLLLVEGKVVLGLYYMGDPGSVLMPAVVPQAPGKDYVYQAAASSRISTIAVSEPEPETVDITEAYKRTDSIPFFTDWDKAKEKARREHKMLMVYYEPYKCRDCGTKFEEIVTNAYDYGYYEEAADSFSRNIVVYKANKTDRNFFRPYGVMQFPAMVVLSSDMAYPVYVANGKSMQSLAYTLFSTSMVDRLKESALGMQLAATIDKGTVSKKDAMAYLSLTRKEDYGVVEVSADAEYAFENYPGTVYNEDKTKLCWQKLIEEYKIFETPDSAVMELLANHEQYVNERYTATTLPVLDYAVKFYPQLHKYGSFGASYYNNDKTLYEWIVSRFDNTVFIEGEETDKPLIAAYAELQRKFLQSNTVVNRMYGPLFIDFLVQAATQTTIQPEWERTAREYCNLFPAEEKALKAMVVNMVSDAKAELGEGFEPGLAYAVARSIPDNNITEELTDDRKMEMIVANALNNYAWYYYQHPENANGNALPLKWSQNSLLLDPQNPYYLDTYAHLLYKANRKAEAIKSQENAIKAASDKHNRTYLDKEAFDNLKVELNKMKKGNL